MNSHIEGLILVTPQPNGRQHRQLVGVCATRTDDDEEECVVETLGISPDFRKKNLGKRLLLSSLAKTDAQFCSLHVRCSNVSATGLYLSVGFQVMDVVSDYYENPNEDAFFMVLSEEKLDNIKNAVN
jgi:ribosomal protein S18 acetylase RimI-like enzyme